MSRTINMTAENDNNIVWLIRITRGADVWKFATKDITLSTNLWDGKALAINDNRFSMNEIGKRINIPSGGTIGEISTITFSFIRYGANTFINDFFNEFYPATSGKILVAMDVEVGMLWDSSTSEDDITWLYKYNVNEYSYSDSQIDLVCSEFSDFEFFNLPYYKVQKELDNKVSYFPDAPEESIGVPIPVVYGSFPLTFPGDDDVMDDPMPYKNISPPPALMTNEATYEYILASHKIKQFNYIPFKICLVTNFGDPGQFVNNNTVPDLFRWVDELNSYVNIYSYDLSDMKNVASNEHSKCTLRLDTDYTIYGDIGFFLDRSRSGSDYTYIKDILDYDEASYIELAAGEQLLVNTEKADDKIPTFGKLDSNAKIRMYVLVHNDEASACDVRLQHVEGATTHYSDFSVAAGATRLLAHPPTGYTASTGSWLDVNDYNWGILNTDASEAIQILTAYIYIHTFRVSGFAQRKIAGYKTTYSLVGNQWQPSGGYWGYDVYNIGEDYQSNIQNFNFIPCDGRAF